MFNASGDNLSVILFLVGLGITFGLAAISQAGWKNRMLISFLFILAASFVLAGFTWPFIKDNIPAVATYTTETAHSAVSWFCMLLFVTFRSLMTGRKTSTSSAVLGSTTSKNTSANAIEILFDHSDRFNNLHIYPNGRADRQIFIIIKNSGNGYLSECSVYIKEASPSLDGYASKVLMPQKDVFCGAEKRVLIASYPERRIDLGVNDDFVTMAQVWGGGYLTRPTTFAAPSAINPQILIVEVSALECRPQRITLKLWVDQPMRRFRAQVA